MEAQEIDGILAEELNKMFENYPGEEHLLYAAALALGSYFNVNIPKIQRVYSNEIKILNGDKWIESSEDLNINFISTLIGSSFISESLQQNLLKLFDTATDINEREKYEIVLSPLSSSSKKLETQTERE